MRRTADLLYMLAAFLVTLTGPVSLLRQTTPGGPIGRPELLTPLDLAAAAIAYPFARDPPSFLTGSLVYQIARFAAYGLAALAVAALARLVARQGRDFLIKYRNGEALSILIGEPTGEAEDGERDYFLYLRPFRSTGVLGTKEDSALNPLLPTAEWFRQLDKSEDLESALSDALADRAPLVALGRPGEHFGAGRVMVNDDAWTSEFMRLAKGASLIFVVPSDTPGCRWELKWLKSHLHLERCLFIAPPSLNDSGQDAEEWSRVSARLKEIQMTLPAFDPAGGFFSMTSAGDGSSLSQPKNWSAKGIGEWVTRRVFKDRSWIRRRRTWLTDVPLTVPIGVSISWMLIVADISVAGQRRSLWPAYLSLFMIAIAFLGVWHRFPPLPRLAAGTLMWATLPLLLMLILDGLTFVFPHPIADVAGNIISWLALPALVLLFICLLTWLFDPSSAPRPLQFAVKHLAWSIAICVGGVLSVVLYPVLVGLLVTAAHLNPNRDVGGGVAFALTVGLVGFLLMRRFEAQHHLELRTLDDLFSDRLRGWRPRWWLAAAMLYLTGEQIAGSNVEGALVASPELAFDIQKIATVAAATIGLMTLFMIWVIGSVNRVAQEFGLSTPKNGIVLAGIAALLISVVVFPAIGYVSAHMPTGADDLNDDLSPEVFTGTRHVLGMMVWLFPGLLLGIVAVGWIATIGPARNRHMPSLLAGGFIIGAWYMLLMHGAAGGGALLIVVALSGGMAFTAWLADYFASPARERSTFQKSIAS